MPYCTWQSSLSLLSCDNKKGRTNRAPFSVRNPARLFLEAVLHFADGGLASLFLRRLREIRAASGGELANQREVTALQLARRELLGCNRGTFASLLSRGLCSRCGGRGGLCGRAAGRTSRRTTGAARTAAGGTSGRASRRTARAALHGRGSGTRTVAAAVRRAQAGQLLFQFTDLTAHVPDITADFTRRYAPFGNQTVENIGRLTGTIRRGT